MDRYLATDDDGQYWATKDSEGEKEDRYRQLQVCASSCVKLHVYYFDFRIFLEIPGGHTII